MAFIDSKEGVLGFAGGFLPPVNAIGATLISVSISSYQAASGVAVTDDLGNTYVSRPSYNTTVVSAIQQWYCLFPANVSSSLVIHATGTLLIASGVVVTFDEVFDIDNGKEHGIINGSGTTVSPGAVTPSDDGYLIIAAVAYEIGDYSSVSAPFQLIGHVPFTADTCIGGAMAYYEQTTAASVNPTFTLTVSDTFIPCYQLVFKVSTVTPPTPIPVTTSDSFTLGSDFDIQFGDVPIGITRGELKTQIANYFENSPYYQGEPDLNNSIQDGYDELIAYAGLRPTKGTFPITNGKTYYDLKTLLPDFVAVIALFNPVTKRWLSPTSLTKLERYGQSWETVSGSPYFFVSVSWRYIAIHPKPVVDGYGNMIIYYMAQAPLLVDDGTVIDSTDEGVSVIEQYVRTDLLEMGQEWSKAGNQFISYLDDLEQYRKKMQQRAVDRIPMLRGQVGT